MKNEMNDKILTIYLEGHIDSANSASTEKEVFDIIGSCEPESVIIDAEDLVYISSSGLRILLKIKKSYSDLKIINVSSDVYEILEVTGFSEIITVEKAYRKLDVTGCSVLGEGANGKVYRYDSDTIVKVYKDSVSLEDIKRERELARTAFILGIPTAIPYDVVKVGDSFGSVFELLDAKSFDELMIEDPEGNIDFVVSESVRVAKTLHDTDAPEGLPLQKDTVIKWIGEMDGLLSEERTAKLRALIDGIPETDKMIHGDYHIKNIMLQNGETLLIDMDTLCRGNEIYELAFMFNAYVGYAVADPGNIEDFLGISIDTAHEIWKRSLKLYFDTDDEERLSEIERKASLIGYLRVARHARPRNEVELTQIATEKLCELIDTVDTLVI